MLIALLVATLLGAINGLVVIWTGIPSFITTLGTMLAYRGIARAIGGGDFAKYVESTPALFSILNGAIDSLNRRFAPMANFRLSIVWFLLIALLMAVILSRTRFGNWIFATGSGCCIGAGCSGEAGLLTAFVMSILTGLANLMQLLTAPAWILRGGLELITVRCVIGELHHSGVGTILRRRGRDATGARSGTALINFGPDLARWLA
jgi:simple sugar transport system permease protein